MILFRLSSSSVYVLYYIIKRGKLEEKIALDSGDIWPLVYSHRHDGSQAAHWQPGKPAHADERWGIPAIRPSTTNTHSLTVVCKHANTHTRRPTTLHSLVFMFVCKSMDVDVVDNIFDALLLCRSSPDLPLYTWQILFSFHKIILATLIFFCVSKSFARVQNNEYHRLWFHCTEVDSGVTQWPSSGSCVKSESVHMQKGSAIRCAYISSHLYTI